MTDAFRMAPMTSIRRRGSASLNRPFSSATQNEIPDLLNSNRTLMSARSRPRPTASERNPLAVSVRCLAVWFDRQVYGIGIEFA
jgi:hypothetical protein